jgi:methylenetetrahydrofolate reductase (NADPH)
MRDRRFLSDYSLEITASDIGRLGDARERLAPGANVFIPYLPGDNLDKLATTAERVRLIGLTPVPHISARRIKSRSELERFLARLHDTAITDRVFVIAGDLSAPIGPYEDALAVIRSGLFAKFGVRQVGIGGYPEGHPQINNDILSRAMMDKLSVIAAEGQVGEIVTQFSFDADNVLDWLARLRSDHIEAPVRIGIPGPANVQSLLRFAARCGVAASTKVMAKYGVSIARLLSTATPDLLVKNLAAHFDPAEHGIVKAHLYTFGGVGAAASWAAAHEESIEAASR